MDNQENVGEFRPTALNRQRPLKTAAEALTLARIIWFAMLVTQGLYLYIGRLSLATPITTTTTTPPSGEASGMAAAVAPVGFMDALRNPTGLAIFAAASMTLVMSFVVPKLLDSGAGSGAPGLGPRGLSQADLPIRLRTRILRFILGVALNEAVAVMGLVVGFMLLKNQEFGAALIYAAMAAMLARFPAAESFADPTGARR